MSAGPPDMSRQAAPSLLVLDTSYTLEMIRERGLEASVLCRDLDGFFRHVWSVHPFATLLTSDGWTDRFGSPVWHELSPRHSFIEGKVGRFAALKRFFAFNFLIAQAGLFLSLFALVRRERIKVIRVGDPLYLGLFGWALARLTGARLVIRINANYDKIRENVGQPIFPRLFPSIAAEKKIECFVLPRADLVAAPSQDNVDFAVANGADPAAVSIFPYGNLLADEHLVEPERRLIEPAVLERYGIERGRFALCIGRLEALKFPYDAVRVLAVAHAAGHDIKLLMVGDGGMRADLAALADDLKVGNHLLFAGNVNQLTLSQLIPASAAVISPLTGRALSEAALGGAAIVAYDVEWQGDLIRTGETGELVPFRDADAMGAALVRLLSDRDYATAMGKGARARALEILNPEKLNDNERAEYGALLARRRGVAP